MGEGLLLLTSLRSWIVLSVKLSVQCLAKLKRTRSNCPSLQVFICSKPLSLYRNHKIPSYDDISESLQRTS